MIICGQTRLQSIHVIPFPKIAVEKLLKYKKSAGVDWDIDVKEYGYKAFLKKKSQFSIPEWNNTS